MAEKRDGMWTMTVDNPAALRPWGETPELTVGADESLSWRYVYEQSSVEYRAVREADGWGSVSCHSRQEDGYGLFEYDVTLEAYDQRPIWVKRNAYRDASGDLYRLPGGARHGYAGAGLVGRRMVSHLVCLVWPGRLCLEERA